MIYYIEIIVLIRLVIIRYNFIRTETHPTELQLIIHDIESIDKLIDHAQQYVTWDSEGKRKKIFIFFFIDALYAFYYNTTNTFYAIRL